MYNIAGKDTMNPSFDLILVIKPSNINTERPADDINKMGLKNKPTNNPRAPITSKIIINIPRCFKLNRSNSLFICGEIKYEIE